MIFTNFRDEGMIYLVTSFMDIDLHKVIYSKQKLSDDHLKVIIYQMIRAVYTLHSANVIHRDLKPSNILANEDCEVKLCDFGLARAVKDDEDTEDFTEYVVTRYYRAPEIMLSSHEYSKPVDIWGLGCTFAEMITRSVLFKGSNYIEQVKIIFEKLGIEFMLKKEIFQKRKWDSLLIPMLKSLLHLFQKRQR